MSEFSVKAFERYAELRPGHRAPSSAADLLAGIEPVFRKVFAPYLPLKKGARILDEANARKECQEGHCELKWESGKSN